MTNEWLNYHHLLYFWSVAKHGTVAKACEELRLAQPTVSKQIGLLEETLGEKLFMRTGRHLVLTEIGHIAFKYADNIFSIGQDFMNTVKGRGSGRPIRLNVGIVDVVPKLLATKLLEAAFRHSPSLHMVCREAKLDQLLADLAIHGLDLVIADSPAPPSIKVQTHNHPLGESGVTFFAAPKLASRYRRDFPRSLEGAPILLPTSNTIFRLSLNDWLARHDLHPAVIAEFEDSATLKAFGQEGHGLFPGSTAMEKEISRQYQVRVVGRVDAVKQKFYAITAERRLKHPAVVALFKAAHHDILA